VVDITHTQTYKKAKAISFKGNQISYATQQSGSGQTYWRKVYIDIPSADTSGVYASTLVGGTSYDARGVTGNKPALNTNPSLSDSSNDIVASIHDTAFAFNNKLTLLNVDKFSGTNHPSAPDSSVAYITSDYNTGYMVGDIKLAALSDTDDTDVVGSELVTTLDFTNFITDDATVLAIEANGDLTVNNGNTVSNTFATSPALPFILGEKYTACIEGTGSGAGVGFYAGTEGGPNGYLFSRSITFTANVTSGAIRLFRYSGHTGTGTLTGISIRLADTDRSVNANGLAVHGTITKTAVASGADLVGYSGFSASNYLEQPYNSDLDFGTGDFSVMGWVKFNDSGRYGAIVHRTSGDNVSSADTSLALYSGGSLVTARVKATVMDMGSKVGGIWQLYTLTRLSGVLSGYINDSLVNSTTCTDDMTDTTATSYFGGYYYGGAVETNGMNVANIRISATAPSAQQIKDIYEAEKPLFQAGAQATLYGTSDAVTALAHDDTTNLLHVGTSSGRSVFQGLQRVSNTTTAVGSAISASNGLVVED